MSKQPDNPPRHEPPKHTPEAVLDEFRRLRDILAERLDVLDEAEMARQPEDSEWSLKERLGHMADNVLHHLQCFVRVQFGDILAFPGFDSAAWVAAQRYQDASVEDIAALWRSASAHFIHVVGCIGPEHWNKPCLIGHDKPRPLIGLFEEYVKHCRRHVRKFAPDMET